MLITKPFPRPPQSRLHFIDHQQIAPSLFALIPHQMFEPAKQRGFVGPGRVPEAEIRHRQAQQIITRDLGGYHARENEAGAVGYGEVAVIPWFGSETAEEAEA